MSSLSRRRKTLFSSFVLLVVLGVAFGLWELLRPKYNFPRSQAGYLQNDPLLGHRHRARARREFEWNEHPRGRIVMETNNQGMRRDGDIATEKSQGTRRILLVGDSHLDGVVYNEETFSAILEQSLNDRRCNSIRFEVLNVATGYYGPDNYAAVLSAYADLGPDLLIVGFYSGNDFLDAVDAVIQKQPTSLEHPPAYRSQLRQASAAHNGAVAQLLNQAFFFHTFPTLVSPTLDRVESLFTALNRQARQLGSDLNIILIPTKIDVEPEIFVLGLSDAMALLHLESEDLRRNSRMRTELASRLKAAGIKTWDPTDVMKRSSEELYWKRDFHLNHRGHRLLAEAFVQSGFLSQSIPYLASSVLLDRYNGPTSDR